MRLVVGLGNPGAEYDDTPHNVGFATLDELARRAQVSFRRGPVAESMTAQMPAGFETVLFKPLSFMNLSGRPVSAAIRWYKMRPQDVFVICDDVNIPFGRLRIRQGGGPGGQKGLNSIIQSIGTESIPRMRMGVGGGYPGADIGNYVLKRLRGKELADYHELVGRGADAIEHWLESGIESMMNKFNIIVDDKDKE